MTLSQKEIIQIRKQFHEQWPEVAKYYKIIKRDITNKQQPRKALHIALNNVQTELDYIEKQIKKINNALHITKIEAQNTYLLLELNNMLSEYSLEKDLTAQKVVSKIRRILYKVSEMENKEIQHGEKKAV